MLVHFHNIGQVSYRPISIGYMSEAVEQTKLRQSQFLAFELTILTCRHELLDYAKQNCHTNLRLLALG